MTAKILTVERVRELFHYSIVAGTFTRLVSRQGPKARAGMVAGTVGANGYIQIHIDGTLYYAHRLAVFYLTGKWPDDEVDHANTDPSFNGWINLRDATSGFNKQNRRTARADSRSGLLGVYWSRQNKGWCASLQVERKSVWLGKHDTKEEAHAAYLDAKRRLHAGCTI